MRAAGLRWGAYYFWRARLDLPAFAHRHMGEMFAGVPTDEAYRAYAAAQVRELIARTKPSVLWNDIAWPDQAEASAVMAGYYDAVPDGVVNDRWLGARNWFERMRESATRDAFNARVKEAPRQGRRHGHARSRLRRFPHDRVLGEHGPHPQMGSLPRRRPLLGYNAQETADTYMTGVDVGAAAGQDRRAWRQSAPECGTQGRRLDPGRTSPSLRETGAWLAANGDAIYATRRGPLHGRTQEGAPFVTTQKDGRVFVILTEGAKPGPVTIPALSSRRALERTGEMPHVPLPPAEAPPRAPLNPRS